MSDLENAVHVKSDFFRTCCFTSCQN